jgi:hypothetical protein
MPARTRHGLASLIGIVLVKRRYMHRLARGDELEPMRRSSNEGTPTRAR